MCSTTSSTSSSSRLLSEQELPPEVVGRIESERETRRVSTRMSSLGTVKSNVEGVEERRVRNLMNRAVSAGKHTQRERERERKASGREREKRIV